jgi:hypothetical protein|tara:strand:- start:970 stop:1218 length:249 start_codon:yes stop_codon:yes gene_type:complete
MEIKKVTPGYGPTWYIKWTASIILLIGMVFTALELTPINLFFHLVGVIGWFVVGYMWHDRAMMVVNSVAIFVFVFGILTWYV